MSTSVLCHVVSPDGTRYTYLEAVGRVSGLSYDWDYSGGPASAQLSLDVAPTQHIPALTIGSKVTICRGTQVAWSGQVSTIQRDSPWVVQVDGIGALAAREPVTTTGSLDNIVDAVITAGLPWSRPASVSTQTWAPTPASDGTSVGQTMLDEVLSTTLLVTGQRWVVDVNGALSAATDPTAPGILIPVTTDPAATLNDYATRAVVMYTSNGSTNSTVTVINAAAEAKFPRVVRAINLSYGATSSTTATAYGNAYLARVAPRMTLTGDFTVAPGQVRTATGAPVDNAMLRPGVLARLQLLAFVRDAMLVPTTSIDVLIGHTSYNADTGEVTLTPEQTAIDPVKALFGGNRISRFAGVVDPTAA